MARRPPTSYDTLRGYTIINTNLLTGVRTVSKGSSPGDSYSETVQVASDSGIRPPQFRPPQPYQVTSTKIGYPVGTFRYDSGSTRYQINGNLRGTNGTLVSSIWPQTGELIPSLRSLAETGALLKLKAQKVNLAVVFAERRKTSEMIIRNFRQIVRMTVGWKKRVCRRLNRPYYTPIPELINIGGKKIASRWLELQYGWTPLMIEIAGSIDALAESTADRDFLFKVHKSEKGYMRGSGSQTTPLGDAKFVTDGIWEETSKVAVIYYCTCDVPEVMRLNELGLINPAEVAWELLPFSFVIDWFIPINDWISTLGATLGYQFKAGTVSVKTERLSRHFSGKNINGVGIKNLVTAYDGSVRSFSFRRQVVAGFPSPFSRLPKFTNLKDIENLDNKMRNISALFVNVLFGNRNQAHTSIRKKR